MWASTSADSRLKIAMPASEALAFVLVGRTIVCPAIEHASREHNGTWTRLHGPRVWRRSAVQQEWRQGLNPLFGVAFPTAKWRRFVDHRRNDTREGLKPCCALNSSAACFRPS